MFSTVESKGILRTATEEFLLSSRYKPHDPLAAEFVRTFRSQNFNGKFYLERYEALCKKESGMDMRVVLPKNATGKGACDVAALYGFRSTAPDLFFLSPWEFVQWIKPERLQPPSANNVLTKWTLAGRKKLASKTKGIMMEAGVDYELDMTAVEARADVFPFPEDKILFGKQVPETYHKLRQTWILRKRQRPAVPAPVVCPMPSRKQSKDHRSKIYSVYLRPWSGGVQ